MRDKICKLCGDKFQAKSPNKTYCSNQCLHVNALLKKGNFDARNINLKNYHPSLAKFLADRFGLDMPPASELSEKPEKDLLECEFCGRKFNVKNKLHPTRFCCKRCGALADAQRKGKTICLHNYSGQHLHPELLKKLASIADFKLQYKQRQARQKKDEAPKCHYRKYSRKCHDCGRPTNDYRCPKCLAKWRSKYKVGGHEIVQYAHSLEMDIDQMDIDQMDIDQMDIDQYAHSVEIGA